MLREHHRMAVGGAFPRQKKLAAESQTLELFGKPLRRPADFTPVASNLRLTDGIRSSSKSSCLEPGDCFPGDTCQSSSWMARNGLVSSPPPKSPVIDLPSPRGSDNKSQTLLADLTRLLLELLANEPPENASPPGQSRYTLPSD